MPPPVSRLDRAAVLLGQLESQTRDVLMQRLNPELAKELSSRIAQMSSAEPSFKQRRLAVDEFEQLLRVFKKYQRPKLKLHQPDTSEEEPAAAPYEPTGNALKDLEHINIYQVSAAFEQEHPRSVALLMKHLTPQRNAEILALLSDTQRTAVVREISLDPEATSLVMQQMAKGAVARAQTFPARQTSKTTSVERLTQMLRMTDKPGRKQILRAVADQDAELAEQVQRALYQFEDLANLSDPEMQLVLGKIDSGTLSMAMFQCSSEVRERIFSNLSKRARGTLQEELEFQRHVPASQVKAARDVIADALAEVNQEAE